MRYVVVGGLAVVLHGHARMTADADLFADHPIPFDELWSRSETVRIGDTPIRIASIPDPGKGPGGNA